jgi:hypothetical protein
MSSFPPPIESLTLRVTTGVYPNVQPFEQTISSANMGSNSVQITNNNGLLTAFNTQPPGTIFNASIVTTYNEGTFTTGDTLSTLSLLNFVPRKITANLSLAPLPELNTLSPSFSLNDYITKNSPAPLSFSSNNTSVVTISSSGLVTIQGVGQATITITQPASTDGVYTAVTSISRVVDVISVLSWSDITKSVTTRVFPLIGDLAPSSNVPISYGNIWNLLGQDIDAENIDDISAKSVSLSVDGTIVAIGAPGNDGNGSNSGHVRVYKYDTTKTNAVTDQSSPDYGPIGWRRLGQDIDGENIDDMSGKSVSLSADGTIVAIGADYNDNSRGHVRVYKYDATKTTAVTDQSSPDFGPVGWRRLGHDIDGEGIDYSGYSVSLSADGAIVAIGAPDNDSYRGHVRVYKYDAAKTTAVTDQSSPDFGPVGWRRLGQDIDGEDAYDSIGTNVSLSADGTILAFGTPYNNGNGNNSGHVRVYKYDVTKTTAITDQSSPDYGPVGWRRLGQDIDSEAANDRSGYSISLSADGTIVAIGAIFNNGNGSYIGHVIVYKYDVTKTIAITDQSSSDYGPVGWRRLGQDIDGETSYDYSGWSVSLSSDGTIVAIGAPYNDGNGNNSGHVRVYKYDATKTTAVTNQSSPDFGPVGWRRLGQDIDGEAANDNSGTSVSLSADGTIVAIGAYGNSSYSGHVRVYKIDSFGNFTYTSDTPAVADVFGNIVLLRSTGETTLTVIQSAAGDNPSSTVDATLTVSPPTLVLVANYSFDSDGNDASTNNNHLTNNNTVTFDTVNFRRGTGAALFDGSNYFQIANDGKFSPDNFTVACWIKPVSSAGDYQSIATCRTGFSPNLSGWMIYIHPDNSLQFWTGNGSSWSGPDIHLYSGFGNLNAWVHVAFTFTKSTGSLAVYINGTLTTTVSRTYVNNTINNLRIGAGATEQNAQFFLRNGTLLDDFRFYEGALSASQVNDIYSN